MCIRDSSFSKHMHGNTLVERIDQVLLDALVFFVIERVDLYDLCLLYTSIPIFSDRLSCSDSAKKQRISLLLYPERRRFIPFSE